jgi:hypothetical protein
MTMTITVLSSGWQVPCDISGISCSPVKLAYCLSRQIEKPRHREVRKRVSLAPESLDVLRHQPRAQHTCPQPPSHPFPRGVRPAASQIQA